MNNRWWLPLVASGVLGGCSLIPQRTGLEIMSYPTAKVYIDNKEAGMTPYRNNTLKPGEVTVRLQTTEVNWEKVIRLENGANTVIDREISTKENKSGGYILYLEATGDSNKAGMMVSSMPDKAAVAVEGEIKGFTPMRLDDIGRGDKQVTISYPGYKTVNIFVKGIPGYQLVIEGNLPEEGVAAGNEVEPTGAVEAADSPDGKKEIMILNTETGWLRVRSGPGAGEEILKAKPGERFEILEEKDGWIKIKLSVGEGWVSAKYVEKL